MLSQYKRMCHLENKIILRFLRANLLLSYIYYNTHNAQVELFLRDSKILSAKKRYPSEKVTSLRSSSFCVFFFSPKREKEGDRTTVFIRKRKESELLTLRGVGGLVLYVDR